MSKKCFLKICSDVRAENKAGNNDSASRRRKLLKILGASSLAIMMGASVLCGVIIAPINSAQASVSSEEILTPQEQLLAGEDLGLEPETDPVIFTTDYGLDIKFHNVGGNATKLSISSNGTSSIVSGYQYITIDDINWIIIGQYSETPYSDLSKKIGVYDEVLNFDATPAGISIKNDVNQEYAMLKVDEITTFSNAKVPENGEIPWGCVLCLSEKDVGSVVYGGSGNYNNSELKTYIEDTFYAGSPELQDLPIVPQNLKTYRNSNETSIYDTPNCYLFPLAGYKEPEQFLIGTYLAAGEESICHNLSNQAQRWWLRTGGMSYTYCVMYVNTSGNVSANDYSSPNGSGGYWSGTSNAVRPAFVLRLYSANQT